MTTEPVDETAVLVIDDEESMREGCRQILEAEGYRTAVAGDGGQGLRLAEEVRPSVALVDLVMPGMNGMEVIKRITELDPHIVMIVITGYGSIESAAEAMRAKVCDYLTKPFGDGELVKAVAGGLARRRLEQRSAALAHERKTALDNFAAVVCHQLRSPAAAAAQWLELVSAEQVGPVTAEQKRILKRARRRVKDMTEIIGDWLKLSSVEAGTLHLEPKPVELSPLIVEAWSAVPDDEARGRVTLQVQAEHDVRPVRGEERLLQQLFTNLFSNSVKFTSGPGKVTVRLSTAGKDTIVSVSDTGIGIPREELPYVFDPFYRGARAGVKRTGGHGLGLAIARKIVSIHGGTIRASSAPGRGATFTLRLPAQTGASAALDAPAIPIAEPAPTVELAAKTLTGPQLSSFVEKMIAAGPVVGVKAKEGTEDRFAFGPLGSASELRLDYDVTILPPKKYLLPARETLVRFRLDNSPVTEPCVEAPRATVLIGVHPYDMIAMNQLDRLMRAGYPDPNYLARREAFTVIGVDPARASEKAFWGAMGCDAVEKGFDLWLTDIGGTYVVEIGSQKGAALLEEYAETRDATEKELEARSGARKKLKELGTTRAVRFRPAELPGLLRRSFESGIWEEKARKCLSCGSCNLVCPTCYCFDVRDEVNISLKEGERYRVWDGCVLEDFAKVGTGENFREKRLARYRHRFYRKGMYLYDRYGHIACVGCGRCATACLPDIADPVAVYNDLKEAETA